MFVCPVPKISQVMMKWRRRASHLGRFILWHIYGRRATQLSRFTLWHNGRRASLRKHPFLLALRRWGRFARNETSGEERGETDVFAGYRRAKQPGFIDAWTRSRTHFPQWRTMSQKYEGLIRSKILLRLLNALEDSTNTDRYQIFSKLLKYVRFIKTNSRP